MRYRYLCSWVLPKGISPQWEREQNSEFFPSMYAYDHFFIQCYIQIQKVSEPNVVFYIKGSNLLTPNLKHTTTFEEYFSKDYDENFFIPVTPEVFDIQYLTYLNAKEHEFQIGLSSIAPVISENLDITDRSQIPQRTPLSQLPDLIILNPRYVTDMSRIHTHGLVTVNGFFHQTEVSEETSHAVYVVDGGKTSLTSGYTEVGLLSFESVGPIIKHPLSELTMTPLDSSGFYGNVLLGGLTGLSTDLRHMQILISIGGFLITPDTSSVSEPIIDRLDDNLVIIDMTRIDIEKKIIEASKYIDLSSTGLDEAFFDDRTYELSDLRTNAILQAFMRLPQSFLVMIPYPNIYTSSVKVYGYNDQRKIYSDPKDSLLKSKNGKIVDYYLSENKEGKTQLNIGTIHRTLNDGKLPSTYQLLKSRFPEPDVETDKLEVGFSSIGFSGTVSLI